MRKKEDYHRSQPNLFRPPIAVPHLESLPREVQQRVRPLLVQLLHDARNNRRAAQAKEGRDE